MKKIHYTDNYLLSPHHPVSVHIIGAGGTGSQVATNLARMDMALRALGHPGLHVTVFDPDTVSEANIGRQLFSESEIGLNKAHQPFLRQHMGGGGPPLSGTQDRKGRQRPYGKHRHHLHGQHPFTS